VVGDVAALGEVRPQERLLHPTLHLGATLRLGQPQQAVGIEGVRPLRLVEVELEVVLGGRAGHLLDDLERALRAAELLRVGVEHRPGLTGGRGVELERPPHHLDLVAPGEAGQRLLEPALPDVAPGADDVGVDLDPRGSVLPRAG
jgi:hypothetical protein